jgi:hypothetical protein
MASDGEPTGRAGAGLMLAVLAAVLADAAFLVLRAHDYGDEAVEFIARDRSLVWVVLHCIESGLWVVVGTLLWHKLRRLRDAYGVDRGLAARLAVSSTVILALALGFAVIRAEGIPPYPLSGGVEYGRYGFLLLGFGIMAMAIVGLWLAEAAAARIPGLPADERLAEYLRLRRELQGFLLAAAVLIGMLLLVGAGLRGAILDWKADASFPAEFILYSGAFYSTLLALAYAPAMITFRRIAGRLRDELLPVPGSRTASWADFVAECKALDTLLELDIAGGKALQTALAIATPLLGSAVGLLLGIGA